MTERRSTMGRQPSQHHQKTIMLEIKIRKHLNGLIKPSPKFSGFGMPPKILKNPVRLPRPSQAKLQQQISELDKICSSMSTKFRSREVPHKKTCLPWKKFRSHRNSIAPACITNPTTRRSLFADSIQFENINKLSRFVEGGYLEQQDDTEMNFNSIGLTHRRFRSLQKMYDIVRRSEGFKECLARSIEPPEDSLASYVYRCEKNTLFRCVEDRGRRVTMEEPNTETVRAKTTKLWKKGSRRRNFGNRRLSMENVMQVNRDEELLQSLKLMKRNLIPDGS